MTTNSVKELLLLHHTHTDIGYTHPPLVVWELHNRHLDEAIDLCEQTADWPEACRMKWTCEVTGTFMHWFEHATESQADRLHALVRNGQIGFGAMWLNWMLPLPHDLFVESLRPVQMIRERFDAPVSVAIQHDVNGIPWSAVDILNDAGIPHLLMGINIHMGGFPLKRPMIFRWAGARERSLTVFSGEHYNAFSRAGQLRAPDMNRMEAGLKQYLLALQQQGWPHDFAFLTATHPFMDDNGPPNPALPGIIRRWNEEGRTPFIRLATPEQLFEKVRALPESGVPVHRGDWTDFWSSGSGSLALETQMMRRAQHAWVAAKSLAEVAGVKLDPAAEQEALRQILVSYEHTVTAFCSTAAFGPSRKMEPLPVAEQWNQKAGCCASALSLARMLRRDLLDTVAKNPAQSWRCDAVLVFNPSDAPRKVLLRMPKDLLAGEYPLLAGSKHRVDVWEDLWREGGAEWAGPMELAGKELKRLSLEQLPPATVADGLLENPDSVSSPHFTLEFDTATGRIQSLKHLASGGECVDTTSLWDFFGPVRETISTPTLKAIRRGDWRYDFFQVTEETFQRVHDNECCWNRDWPVWHERALVTRVFTRVDAEGAHLIRVSQLAGIDGELEQTVSLLAHEPRVRFEAYFNKGNVTFPEALYFSFPCRMTQARMHFDAGGQATQFDMEQLPGACRDWLPAGDWVSVSGTEGCLVMACPDAPLWQVGGFNYGRGITSAADLNQAFLLAWPMNNYWNTNFRAAQPGFLRLRWELAFFEKFNAHECARFGMAAAQPVIWHPVGQDKMAML